MKTKLLIIVVSTLTIFFSCKDENINEPENKLPVIQNLTANPSSIKINETSSLSCIAIDADGENLTYSWSANQGAFTNGSQDSLVIWRAPNIAGIYEIGVLVSDGIENVEDIVNVEVKINSPPTKPNNPIPKNGATEQLISLTLSWNSTESDGDSLFYDLYFGTNPNPELLISNFRDTNYNPVNLYVNTTYYWKIVAKDGIVETAGDVWSFTTKPAESNMEFVIVPAGTYTYGEGDQSKTIDYDFEIMKYEVTNTQYIDYLNKALAAGVITVTNSSVSGYYSGDSKWPAGEYEFYDLDQVLNGYNVEEIIWDGSTFSIASDFENHPVVLVTWFGANAFARHYGCRLPIEEEWEKTARGNTGFTFPWGNSLGNTDANFWHSNDPWEKGTTPVGFYNGQNGTNDRPSPYGAYDMCGNVWEWINDFWDSSAKSRVLRGGAWNINGTNFDLKSFSRYLYYPNITNHYTGFRCLKE